MKDATGEVVGCHKTRADALAHMAALYANEESDMGEVEQFAIDSSAWDGNRAMTECKTAADYGKICAGRKAGDPAFRSSHALPHHYLSKAPTPNADGVRAALQRFSQTQGLTNAGAARAHLEAHMSQISPENSTRSGGENFAGSPMPTDAGGLRGHLSDAHGMENAGDMSFAEAQQAHSKAHSSVTPRSDHSHVEAAGLAIREDGLLLARGPLEPTRHTGRADELLTVRGYPAVYGVPSHDMGGFRTVIAPGAFDDILATNPDVHFVWDHDTRYPLARTKNGTLSLSSDEVGLHMEAQVGQYTYAEDLKLALRRGDVDQGSVAITVGEDEWAADDDENVFRTIKRVDGLFDATVTAQGAFPQTSLAAAESLMRKAAASGRLPAGAKTLVAARGGQGSSPDGATVDAETVREVEELKHKLAVRQDEIDALIERAGKLR